MTQYFERPELPGKKHFQCDRLLAAISVEACAGMWRQANDNNVESRQRCKRCPLGAIHANEPDASLSAIKGSLICARCRRPASRLISGEHCVSCKNREYEFVKGRNAKGSRPVKMTPLVPRCIRYLNGREPCTLRRHLTKDTDELVITALRESKHRVAIGFHATALPRQQRLFP